MMKQRTNVQKIKRYKCGIDKCEECSYLVDILCYKCEEGYEPELVQCQKMECGEGCEVCESAEKCKTCKEGYKVNNTSQCNKIECGEGCAVCENEEKCKTCKEEYENKEGKCEIGSATNLILFTIFIISIII